jgi:hypothetical protein
VVEVQMRQVERLSSAVLLLFFWLSTVNDAHATPVVLDLEFTSVNGLPVMGQDVPAGGTFSGTVMLDAELTINGVQDVGVLPAFELVVGEMSFERMSIGVVFVDISDGLITGVQISTGPQDFGSGQSGYLSTTMGGTPMGGTWGVLRHADPINIHEGEGVYTITSQVPEPSTSALVAIGLATLGFCGRRKRRGTGGIL